MSDKPVSPHVSPNSQIRWYAKKENGNLSLIAYKLIRDSRGDTAEEFISKAIVIEWAKFEGVLEDTHRAICFSSEETRAIKECLDGE